MVRLNRNTTTGAISQPAGAAGCISETGAGACADGHALGRVMVGGGQPRRKERLRLPVERTQWRASFATRPRGRSASPPGPPAASARTGAGPCADGHALDEPRLGGGEPGREERVRRPRSAASAVVRLNRNPTTGAISQPAGTAGCISETGAGPCADGHGLECPGRGGGQPGRKERLRRLRYSECSWRASTATPTTGAISQPAGAAGCVSDDGAGPCADGHGLEQPCSVAVSPDGKSVYVASDCISDAVVRLNRNTTTGAITQPTDRPGCISESGRGDLLPTATGSTGRSRWRSARMGRASTPPRATSVAVARLSRNTTTGRSPSPPGPPAA